MKKAHGTAQNHLSHPRKHTQKLKHHDHYYSQTASKTPPPPSKYSPKSLISRFNTAVSIPHPRG